MSFFTTFGSAGAGNMADYGSEKIATSTDNKANGVLGVNDEKGILDGARGMSYDVAVSKDGLKLQPQPTADPLDPLNWTSWKKHTILAMVMYL